MTDALELLRKATGSIAALEALAREGGDRADAEKVHAWAREHFRELLAVERALRASAKAAEAAPVSAPVSAPGSMPARTSAQAADEPVDRERLLRSFEAVTSADQTESMGAALGALLAITGAQRGFIALRGDDGHMTFPAARAFGTLDVASPEAQLSLTILGAAMRGGTPLVVDDARADERFGAQGSVQALGLRAVLVVPLAARGKPFGVLYLDNPARAAAFGGEARRAAEDFARLVAPVLARDVELGDLRRDRELRLAELRERFDLGRLHGKSRGMLDVLERIARVAPRDTTVLVTGETGTGKELVAEAIHANSPRAEGRFVAVNCGALPLALAESELFGHERGAFTGATAARAGRFEAAHKGTLFLDEIGELPMAIQVKLLRVLETGTFERVGATRPTRCDVRVIAATNRDLDAEVAAGRFRADLLFRLKVIDVHLPPLRQREGDVALLARHFVERFGKEHGTRVRAIHPAALEALGAYAWPGNVRELRNVLERAVILAPGDEVTLDLLPPEIAGSAPSLPESHGLKQAVRAFKRRFVDRAFAETGGDHAAAAKRLGVHPKYLYQLVRDLEDAG